METDTHASSLPRWLKRMLAREGKGAYGSSKHQRGKQKPRHYRKNLRIQRKRQRQARLVQRGKR